MKFVRYFLVGGFSATVDIICFAVAVKLLGFNWSIVALCSFMFATAVNYLLSVRFVFESGIRFNKHTEVSLVFLMSGVGMAINQGILLLLIEMLEVDEVLSKLFATGTVFLWNYTVRSWFIFKSL